VTIQIDTDAFNSRRLRHTRDMEKFSESHRLSPVAPQAKTGPTERRMGKNTDTRFLFSGK